MSYSDRTNEMTILEGETKTSDDGDYVDPPATCLWCLVPQAGTLVACSDLSVYGLASLPATMTGVTVSQHLFNTHDTSTYVGPPETIVCAYTGSGFTGVVYGTADSDSSDVYARIYIQAQWTAGTTSGVVQLYLKLSGSASGWWEKGYTGAILAAAVYANRAAFIVAANAAIAAATSVSLDVTSSAGTPPAGITFPDPITIDFT